MTLFWIGAGLLVLGAVGLLVTYIHTDINLPYAPNWARYIGMAGLAGMVVGAVTIAASFYYAIAGWLT